MTPVVTPRPVGIGHRGIDLIFAERLRQEKEKGYDAAHDDRHAKGELADFALAILNGADPADYDDPESWVTEAYAHLHAKYAHDPICRLAIAGALIAAEIDRLQRAKAS